MSPFDFLNEINYGKKDIMGDDIAESNYNSFLINRSLSYFPDTVLAANEININHHIDNKLQYDFLINIVRKRKRFSKWNKKTVNSDIEVIKEYYGYSNDKAYCVLSLLNSDQLKELQERVYKGGTK